MNDTLSPRFQPQRRILFRTIALSWIVILFALGVFLSFLIPYQKELLTENMNIQGRLITASVLDKTASSVILEDFSAVVDQCMTVVTQNSSLLYLVLTRKDGFSLVHTQKGWSEQSLSPFWRPSRESDLFQGCLVETPFLPQEVYNLSSPFNYSGIEWGWIHVGISPAKYYDDRKTLLLRIFLLAMISASLGFTISYYFAQSINRPIRSLEQFVRTVAEGNMTSRIQIQTGDELEVLGHSFNWMVESLQKSQENLIAARDYLHNTIQSMNEMLLIVDGHLKIQTANRAICELLGYQKEEILNQKLHNILVSPNLPIADLPFFVKDRPLVNKEALYQTKEGKRIPVLLSCASMTNPNHQGSEMVMIAMDITERKWLESQLYQAHKMEAIGQLAGGIAHNINNLLTGIIGNQSLAYSKAPDYLKDYLKSASNAASRAAELVNELLAFSRKSTLEMKPLSLNQLMTEVYGLIRQTINRRIAIVVEPQDNLPVVLGDASQIHSVLMNLCINARDAIEKKMHGERGDAKYDSEYKIVMKTNLVTVGADHPHNLSNLQEGQYIVLSVSDNGIGIAEENQKHIFEPFFTTKKNVGNGLGLASAFGIIKQHNGAIDFSSEYRSGTIFSIYLPVIETKPTEHASPTDCCELSGGDETVLFVDDEALIVELGKDILSQYGYRVLTACDGREGLEIFRQNKDKIHLTILDLSMPNLTGIEVFEQIRRINPLAKVIISSGYSEGAELDSIQEIGVNALVKKPYRPHQLIYEVRNAIDS